MASNMTDAEVEALGDAAELQRLLKEQLALNRNAAAGGGGRSGALWKGEPPSLDESEDYGVWKKKLKVWQMATGLDDKQQAAAVIQGIIDDHKYHKKGLLFCRRHRDVTDWRPRTWKRQRWRTLSTRLGWTSRPRTRPWYPAKASKSRQSEAGPAGRFLLHLRRLL